MTTALYRRYRPETFAEMIGQAQVTDPLMTALRGDRVGHAYLFSGPRGCGKTTSARILARCLNCAQGPTDTPCGTCPSCVELSRGGSGSLDVVEIDAASHNGVDDARDLRERAIFAPARDRYKIFILDEAHMVTQQGFNALLKLVEEPPDHVKFIFATTEPEKVLGTIRSRTHHYPFRLVPPGAMLDYVAALCEQEAVTVEPGVLALVVRAGGGSPRDTLSLLDQLIAGSEGGLVTYPRTVALLGYTHAELLDEVVDAFATGDAGAAFAGVDRVVQTGQDPRRFVDDLLERLRDLIVIAATGQVAAAVLRDVPADEMERMSGQAARFGAERLSRTADIVVAALDELTGATSPRLQLELMIARVLTRTAPAPQQPAEPVEARQPTPVAEPVEARQPLPVTEPSPPVEATPVAGATPAAEPTAAAEPTRVAESVEARPEPVTLSRLRESWPEVLRQLEPISRASWLVASNATVLAFDGEVLTLAFSSDADVAAFKRRAAGSGPSEDLRRAIGAVLGIPVKYIARRDSTAPAPDPDPGPGPGPAPDPGPGAGARPVGRNGAPASSPDATTSKPTPTPDRATPTRTDRAPVTDWVVAPIPTDAPGDGQSALGAPVALAQLAVDAEPEDAASEVTPAPTHDGDVVPDAEPTPSELGGPDEADVDMLGAGRPVPSARLRSTAGVQRYGEAVVRQVLGATFVREEPYQAPTRFQ